MLTDFRNHKRFFFIVTSVLFLSFSINFFGTVSTDEFILNYKDSEALVSNDISCKGNVMGGQLLAVRNSKDKTSNVQQICNQKELEAYSSQFGLQGRIYAEGYKLISLIKPMKLNTYIALSQVLTALVSAFSFALLTLWVRSRFSLGVAVIFASLISLSPMIVGFARNLYWAEALMILPLVFTLYFYQSFSKTESQKKILFWMGLGSLLYIRYLCGYEYLTTFTIMPMAAIAYYLYIGRQNLNVYIKQFLLVGTVSIIAFFGAVSTHILTLTASTGSINRSINVVKARAQERTLNVSKYVAAPYENLSRLAPDYYKITDTYLDYQAHKDSNSKYWSVIVAIANYMLLSIIHLPIQLAPSFSVYLQSFTTFFVILVMLYLLRKKLVNKGMLREVEGLYLGLVIGLAGYLSWLIFALPHALVHAHINGILMYLPTGLIGFIIMGLFIEQTAKKYL